jgi:hypothetical protein
MEDKMTLCLRGHLLLVLALPAFMAPVLILRGQQETGQASTGTIRGIVVREGTSEPIPDVQILIRGAAAANPGLPGGGRQVPPNGPARPATSQLSAITDSGGHFVIEGVPAGQQTLAAQREGYFGVSVNGIAPVAVTTSVRVTAQQSTEARLTMVPGAAISGRITTANGSPASEASVEVLRIAYQNGEPVLQLAGMRQTDDRGEYRVFRIPPGDYFLAVSARPAGARGVVPVPSAPLNPQALPVRTFYPKATTVVSAVRFPVSAGDEVRGMDIQIQTVVGATVSGRVVSQLPANAPNAGTPRASNATVTLVPRDRNTQVDARLGLSVSASIASPNDGAFQLSNVPPGEYDLYASLPDPSAGPAAALPILAGVLVGEAPVTGEFRVVAPAGGPGAPGTAYGRVSVDVRGGNVDGITVLVHRGVDLQGKITIDGKPASTNIPLSLQPLDSFAGVAVPRLQPAFGPDGSFTIAGVPEAVYRVNVGVGAGGGAVRGSAPAPIPGPASSLPANSYVADIRQAGVSVYDDGIRVGTSQAGQIEILINSNGGTIQGTVQDSQGQPIPAATVVLVPPPDRRKNPALYKMASSNAEGAFTMASLPPGQYKLFAWASIPASAYQNAEFMRQYEERGVAVSISGPAAIAQRLGIIR